MKSHSELISLIDSYSYPAQFKAADTGKYLFSNRPNAGLFGLSDPAQLEGLTVHDLDYANQPWGVQHAARMARLDLSVLENQMLVSDTHAFLGHRNDVRYHEIIKFPVLGSTGNILAIVSCAQDIKDTLSYPELYQLYRRFADKTEAIQATLEYLGGDAWFPRLPTEAEFTVFLQKAEGDSDKKIAKRMRIGERALRDHLDAMRDKVADGNLERPLAMLRREPQCEPG